MSALPPLDPPSLDEWPVFTWPDLAWLAHDLEHLEDQLLTGLGKPGFRLDAETGETP